MNGKTTLRLPEWFKVERRSGENYGRVRGLVSGHGLHTVCQEALCPNIWECWNSGTATFMILGERCTRDCRFCGVPAAVRPLRPDPAEPEKIAESAAALGLAWVVITSVTRDDLADYGAGHFSACVKAILDRCPGTSVELLIPDFRGEPRYLDTVAASGASVIAHNVETVPSLYGKVRPQADYARSLGVLKYLAETANGRYSVKSSIMVGLGETTEEVQAVLSDLAATGCASATIGQYLPPSKEHLSVERFYTPAEFSTLAEYAKKAGIDRVASGPLVRSSYMAHELAGGS